MEDKLSIIEGIKDDEVKSLAKHMNVTEPQLLFLQAYEDCLNIQQAAKEAGMHYKNINRDLKRNTPFAKLFKKLSENLDDDPRFNRIGSISMLMDLKKRAAEEGKLDLEFKIVQEINKMISGNIAATRKVVENVDITVNGIIDLTKKPIKQNRTNTSFEDVKYMEVADNE